MDTTIQSIATGTGSVTAAWANPEKFYRAVARPSGAPAHKEVLA